MHIQIFSLVLLLISSSYSLTLNSKPQVAIVGGGVGGLVSSALLSRSGLDVLLVEKNERCGGRMNSEYLFVKEDQRSFASQYRFDVGPSLLLLPDIYKKTFEILGTKIENHVELLKVEPFYR
jgi:phytoene dehydrogenase-like protein